VLADTSRPTLNDMSRRADSERIYRAQLAGTFKRLVMFERIDELDAEHWIARWKREAEATGRDRRSGAFWDEGWARIAEQRRIRLPFPDTDPYRRPK
jgi:hypothetical protein